MLRIIHSQGICGNCKDWYPTLEGIVVDDVWMIALCPDCLQSLYHQVRRVLPKWK